VLLSSRYNRHLGEVHPNLLWPCITPERKLLMIIAGDKSQWVIELGGETHYADFSVHKALAIIRGSNTTVSLT